MYASIAEYLVSIDYSYQETAALDGDSDCAGASDLAGFDLGGESRPPDSGGPATDGDLDTDGSPDPSATARPSGEGGKPAKQQPTQSTQQKINPLRAILFSVGAALLVIGLLVAVLMLVHRHSSRNRQDFGSTAHFQGHVIHHPGHRFALSHTLRQPSRLGEVVPLEQSIRVARIIPGHQTVEAARHGPPRAYQTDPTGAERPERTIPAQTLQ